MFFRYDNENIQYIGRWAPYEGTMTATAPGSRFSVSFSGNEALLYFDTEFNQTPMPHLWISVDGGARVEVTLDRFIRIYAPGNGIHTVSVIMKSMVEMYPRWKMPLANKISFMGLDAAELAPTPKSGKKTIEFVGDSITEGVLTDPYCAPRPIDESKISWTYDEYNRPWQDDTTATYAWLTAEKLGLEPIMMGYGATGTGRSGCGGVPSTPEAYPYCFEGAPTSYPHPDYVFINHGTNDRPDSSEVFRKNYTALIETIYAAHPETQIICMIPFIGAHAEDIEAIVKHYNQSGKSIVLIDGSKWLPPEPLHPDRAGHAHAAEMLAPILKEKLGL
ncbi:MAG: hypothetical protein IIW23_01460 [Clostridia bacterium]|nr:hypothetical protein [Clostridia bacterium]